MKYMGRVEGGAFYVHQNGFTVQQHDPTDWNKLTSSLHGLEQSGDALSRKLGGNFVLKSHAYRVNFLGGAGSPEIVADKPLPSVNNYFISLIFLLVSSSNCKLVNLK